MTAYELFRRVHIHHSGQFLSKIWEHKVKDIDPREDAKRSFEEDVDEYSVKWANGKGFELEYNPANKALQKVDVLKQIDVKPGYILCHYDGHTGSWYFWQYASKSEALAAYRGLYERVYRHQFWYRILKV